MLGVLDFADGKEKAKEFSQRDNVLVPVVSDPALGKNFTIINKGTTNEIKIAFISYVIPDEFQVSHHQMKTCS